MQQHIWQKIIVAYELMHGCNIQLDTHVLVSPGWIKGFFYISI